MSESSQPYGLKILRGLRLDSVLLIDGGCEICALAIVTVPYDDPVRLRIKRGYVAHQLLAIRVSGESIDGLPLHLDLQIYRLSAHVQRDLGPSSLNSPSYGSFRLVSDEEKPILLVVRPFTEVLHDRSA